MAEFIYGGTEGGTGTPQTLDTPYDLASDKQSNPIYFGWNSSWIIDARIFLSTDFCFLSNVARVASPFQRASHSCGLHTALPPAAAQAHLIPEALTKPTHTHRPGLPYLCGFPPKLVVMVTLIPFFSQSYPERMFRILFIRLCFLWELLNATWVDVEWGRGGINTMGALSL